uniref:Uncharacterized protein n=1 Tax=Panagrolaimus superbus TaxID=310955 RepID=A0A914XTF7_9BILA
MDVGNKSEMLGDSEVKNTEATIEVKKDKKEGGTNAKVAENTSPAFMAAAVMPLPTFSPSINEPLKSDSGAGAETISFTKTVDLPLINKPNDKQNVFVVGDKGNATFSRTLNSLSVEAHNIL